jgi:excisionase family DNA binding protein
MQTIPEAAKMLGLSPSTLRHQVKNGKLKAIKLARDWFVTDEEVERYRRENRRSIEDVVA